jgi:hypothetical protein
MAIWSVLLTATFMCGYAFGRRGSARVYGESVSPDGRFRAVITEQAPSFPMQSPYIYRFSIHQTGSDSAMEGSEHVRDTDSTSLGDFHVDWTDTTATVRTPHSSPRTVIATFSEEQQWAPPSRMSD